MYFTSNSMSYQKFTAMQPCNMVVASYMPMLWWNLVRYNKKNYEIVTKQNMKAYFFVFVPAQMHDL